MKRLSLLNRVSSTAAAAWIGLCLAGAAHAGVLLTDSAVFSANTMGENWNGMFWNTEGAPDDRWNLYYSSSADPDNPVFLNTMDDANTSLSLDLGVGTHSFVIFGDSTGIMLDPAQHFVLSLYFGGNQGGADISGLYGPDCLSVCAVSHWNGLDLFGDSGLGANLDAQEAGTLLYGANGYQVELTGFSWNVVTAWPVWFGWDKVSPYNNDAGNGRPDFVGTVELRVIAVAEPMAMGLTGMTLGLAALIGYRRRRC